MNSELATDLEVCKINYLSIKEDVIAFINRNVGRAVMIKYVDSNVKITMEFPLDDKGMSRVNDILKLTDVVIQGLRVTSNYRL